MHEIPDLSAIQDLLRTHCGDLTYVSISRESPRKGTLERFEWDEETARERGLLGDADTLEDACLRWMESCFLADATPGERDASRVRLAGPGGGLLKQRVVRLEPSSTIDEMLGDPLPVADDRAVLEALLVRAVEMSHGLVLEQRSMYREVLAEHRTGMRELRTALREASEDRRALFDKHVERELGIVTARERAISAREAQVAAAAERPDAPAEWWEGLGKTAAQLWAAHNDLPPDFVSTLAEDEELRGLVSDPRALRMLKDPETRAALRAMMEAM